MRRGRLFGGKKAGPVRVSWRWWLRAGSRMGAGVVAGEVWPAGTAAGDALRRGEGVAASLRGAGWQLPRELWAVLEAGERTGRLAESMAEIGEALARREQMRREVQSQLSYPILLVAAGTGVMALLVGWVIPRMRELLEGLLPGGELPFWTEHVGLIYGGFLAGGVGLFAVLSGTAVLWERIGRYRLGWSRAWERLWQTIPGWGRYRFRAREARLLRVWGRLVGGGWTVARALEMMAAACPARWEREQLEQLRSRLLMGSSFGEALGHCALVATEDRALLEAGQESGRLEEFLERVAGDLERQNRWARESWMRLLEPVFLACLTLAVGGLLVAYFLPLVELMEGAGF